MASASSTDSFDWLSQATARILGTSVAASPLRRDRLLKDMPEAERVAFSRALRQRFRRVVDEKTERVTWVIATGLPLSGAGNGDPELERLARTLIPPIRGALDEVLPDRCRDAVCAQDVAAGLAGLRDQLTRLDEELRAPPSEGYVRFLLGEMTREFGALQILVTPGRLPPYQSDVADVLDLQAITAAIAIFNGLAAAVNNRLPAAAGITNVVGFYRRVERAAQPLSDGASNLLRQFASLGIDEAQLQAIHPTGVGFLPAAPAGQLMLGELLRRMSEEPKLWSQLTRTGNGQHVQRIQTGARAIRNGLRQNVNLNGRLSTAQMQTVVARLGLSHAECCDDGRSVLSQLSRLVALGDSLLTPIEAANVP